MDRFFGHSFVTLILVDHKICWIEEYSQVYFVHVLLQLNFISSCVTAAITGVLSLLVVLLLNVPSQVAPRCARMLALWTVVPHPIVNGLLVDLNCKQTWNFWPVSTQVTDTQVNIGLCLVLFACQSFLNPLIVSSMQVPLKVKLAPAGPLALLARVEDTPVLRGVVLCQVGFRLRLVETSVAKQPTVVLSDVRFEKDERCKSVEADQAEKLLFLVV